MKISVSLNIETSKDANTSLDVVVGAFETIASVKDKIASAHLIPFPDQQLCLEGTVLNDAAKVSACGIKEGSALVFDVKASEAVLAKQLTELLEARDLSADELSLLYCYKHGVSVKQALLHLGFDGKLQDFINKQKTLSMENGMVAIVKEDAALKPFSVAEEIAKMLKASDSGTMDIKDLSAKFITKFGVSLSSIIGGRPGEFLAKDKTFVLHGKGYVSLAGTKKQQPVSPAPAGPTAVPAAPLAPPPGLAPRNVSPAAVAAKEESAEVSAQQYLDLHNKICGRAFNSRVIQVTNDLIAALSDSMLLDVDHVVSGGAIGKGTATEGAAKSELVLFLRGLPPSNHGSWFPPLLKAVSAVLSEDFQTAHDLESVQNLDDCIRICTRGSVPVTMDLYLSPAFDSYSETLKALNQQTPDARRFFRPSLAKERTQFVARQPSSVKVTMRLVKWWRDQQEWYGKLARPSDELLELAAIYSAIQTKPADQKIAIANLMALLSSFDQMRVVWSNYYSKDDVPQYLLRQRPLLMDPTNPYTNVADPELFDSKELIILARETHFFW